MNKASFIRFRFPLENYEEYSVLAASGIRENMQELIQAKSFRRKRLELLDRFRRGYDYIADKFGTVPALG